MDRPYCAVFIATSLDAFFWRGMRLIGSHIYSSGLVQLRYAPLAAKPAPKRRKNG